MMRFSNTVEEWEDSFLTAYLWEGEGDTFARVKDANLNNWQFIYVSCFISYVGIHMPIYIQGAVFTNFPSLA